MDTPPFQSNLFPESRHDYQISSKWFRHYKDDIDGFAPVAFHDNYDN